MAITRMTAVLTDALHTHPEVWEKPSLQVAAERVLAEQGRHQPFAAVDDGDGDQLAGSDSASSTWPCAAAHTPITSHQATLDGAWLCRAGPHPSPAPSPTPSTGPKRSRRGSRSTTRAPTPALSTLSELHPTQSWRLQPELSRKLTREMRAVGPRAKQSFLVSNVDVFKAVAERAQSPRMDPPVRSCANMDWQRPECPGVTSLCANLHVASPSDQTEAGAAQLVRAATTNSESCRDGSCGDDTEEPRPRGWERQRRRRGGANSASHVCHGGREHSGWRCSEPRQCDPVGRSYQRSVLPTRATVRFAVCHRNALVKR